MEKPHLYKPLFGFYDEDSSAGFDLNRVLITHPSATFFVRIKYVRDNRFGILSGDIAIVDRAMKPVGDTPVLIYFHGKFLIKSAREIPKFQCEVWGVVTYVIHKYG